MTTYLKQAVVLAFAFALLALPARLAIAADEYSFKVHNSTDETITKLLASEDGEEYGNFDVGKEGIAPGKSMTLVWDKSTNKSGCHWYFKAVFADGSESKAKQFDFCKEGLELEF